MRIWEFTPEGRSVLVGAHDLDKVLSELDVRFEPEIAPRGRLEHEPWCGDNERRGLSG